MKVVIVGGVAGGASAAARLRRLDEHHVAESHAVLRLRHHDLPEIALTVRGSGLLPRLGAGGGFLCCA